MILALLAEDSVGDVAVLTSRLLLGVSSSSTSIAEWVELTLGARFTVGLILRPPNGTNFESGLDSVRSLSVAVVSRDEARLFVDATLRATLRTEAEED